MAVSAGARRWIGLIAVALGVALIVVDTTIVNVITPSVIDDLGINSSQAQWIQESYAIVFAALLLVSGRIADLRGARSVFIGGVVIFGATSLLAGLASNGEILILARFLQGIGAAAILPTSLALLNHMFTGPARGQAFAVWGSTIGAATALGPVLGGWLSEHASWRWAFGINIPLVIIILVIAVIFLPQPPRSRGSVDGLSAVLSILGLGLLAFGLVEGRVYGWVMSEQPFTLFGATWDAGLSPAFVALVLSVVLMTVFVCRQVVISRVNSKHQPLMDVKLFSISSFRNGNIATLIIGLGEFGIIAVLPLWLQFTLDYTPLEAGATLVPIAIGSFVASGISFPLSAKVSPLALVRIGLILEVVGLAGLGLVAAVTDANWWFIALVLFFYGIGVGFATSQVTNVVLADVPEGDGGQSSGIQSTFRQLGSALGIAALTTVFFSSLGSTLQNKLTDAGLSGAEASNLSNAVTDSAGAAIGPLAANPETVFVADAAREAMTQAIAFGSYLAAGFLIIGVVATLLIPSKRLTEKAHADSVSTEAQKSVSGKA
ncbi:MFS transporter (plasmid) [Cryobacterium sp. LW097]|uniref:MFS transporter n=1 Tax=unclassified Cryobacterium TaxID=2649013 RepID=UPI000B4CD18A|nr:MULTISPECIES: MFS transporter [unclassified Cryobacterium]ASD24220.1 MFS transporter [Cryobacterium sp. LW097]TFC57886.1 DHA2 family efflux MFS transporter permease subunit [Cryobacterium sp. TMB3-1-2]TFC75383.1 DHA2 family efflux MFS transporter permease subunit [Cryobacterium sp. TMB3-15]TFC77881.1 DHA2 family efflux MFS transporter permease subunit [Cryobacterium sp. TMB3-10]TFD46422.1 DHA2 family efflux MFS transporter permease subunit [Cryobacterium sp. TMB3-12]